MGAIGTATYLGDNPGRAAAYDVALLDVSGSPSTASCTGWRWPRPRASLVAEFAPYARGVFALLLEMAERFARQADEGVYPEERSTIASAAASLRHIVETAAGHGLDIGTLEASGAVLDRAVAAGHGDDGLSRLVDVVPIQASAHAYVLSI